MINSIWDSNLVLKISFYGPRQVLYVMTEVGAGSLTSPPTSSVNDRSLGVTCVRKEEKPPPSDR